MVEIILAKHFVMGENPLLFLAGPIRGAPKWHYDAMKYMLNQDITIAAPIREITDNLRPYLLHEEYNPGGRQRKWELPYLNEAWKNGCVLFWLPGEIEHTCSKAYGAMTREELGLTLMRNSYDPSTKFVIGTDGDFSEFRTLLVDIERFAPDVPIHSTLEETCDAALEIALADPFENNFGQ